MKKLLQAMNKLVFVRKRTENEVFDIKSLAYEILCDFFLTAEYIRSTNTHFMSPYIMSLGYMDKRIKRFESKSYIGAAMWISENSLPYGSGFTPKLATREKHHSTLGFNCLGKAIVLGMYLQGCKHNYQVFLGITFGTFTDHGLIILKLKNNYFLCDTGEMKLKKLHGEMKEEKGYIWYEKSSKDDFSFNCIVIQDFNLGMINAIIGHFIFLQKKSPNDLPALDRKYLIFKDKKFKMSTIINRTPWDKIQTEYFNDLNQYREKYHEKYVTECLFVDLQRQSYELKTKYDKIIKDSFKKAFQTDYTPEKNKAFIEVYTPLLKSMSGRVIAFFEGNPFLGMHLPRKVHLYFKTIKEEIHKDKAVKGFAIRKLKERLEYQQTS